MPPLKSKAKDARSRVGTPSLGDGAENHAGSAGSAQATNSRLSYDDILDKYCKAPTPPPSAILKKIHEALLICRDVAKDRSDQCDKGIRDVSRKKKELFQLQQEQEIEEARAEEERQAELRRGQKEEEAKSRPPAVGARGLAPQDGTVGIVSPGKSIFNYSSPDSAVATSHVQPHPLPQLPHWHSFDIVAFGKCQQRELRTPMCQLLRRFTFAPLYRRTFLLHD